MNQVVRPNIPYRGTIPGGLHDGKLIEIRGVAMHGADTFSINLQTGMNRLDPQSDRALHISVRFPRRQVVRNHFEMNRWGPEETAGIFPFHHGQEFTLKIQVERTAYRIAVNEQHCWEFVHRIPTMRVSSIFIEGHVQIERIEYMDRYQPATCGVFPAARISTGFDQYQPSGIYPAGRISPGYDQYPQPGVCGIPPTPAYPARISPGVCVMPGIPMTPAIPSYPILGQGIGTGICPPPEQICPQPAYIGTGGSNLAPVYNPNVPYAYPIYGGLKIGMTMHITGRPTTNNSVVAALRTHGDDDLTGCLGNDTFHFVIANANMARFTLNLQSGTSPYPPPELALHFDARLFSRSIARNSRTNNVWEREESITPHFPFRHGVRFELIIRVDPDRFMVAVDNQHYVEFRHRLYPLERFDTLYIENDIAVESIRFT